MTFCILEAPCDDRKQQGLQRLLDSCGCHQALLGQRDFTAAAADLELALHAAPEDQRGKISAALRDAESRRSTESHTSLPAVCSSISELHAVVRSSCLEVPSEPWLDSNMEWP